MGWGGEGAGKSKETRVFNCKQVIYSNKFPGTCNDRCTEEEVGWGLAERNSRTCSIKNTFV